MVKRDFPGPVLEQLEPKVYMTCTRRRDGAATRVGVFSRLGAVNEHVADEETEGTPNDDNTKWGACTNVPIGA